jgi:hypothetical protein
MQTNKNKKKKKEANAKMSQFVFYMSINGARASSDRCSRGYTMIDLSFIFN